MASPDVASPPSKQDAFRRLVEVTAEAEALKRELGRSAPTVSTELPELPYEIVTGLVHHYVADMLSVHDPDGTFRWASPSSHRVYGWPAEELVGKNSYGFFHPEDVRRIQESHVGHIEDRTRDGSPVHDNVIEYRARREDGTYEWVETHAHSRLNEKGQVESIICTTRNVDRRKRLEQEREQLLDELRHRLDEIEHPDRVVPVCAWCKSVRSDHGWECFEEFVSRVMGKGVTHGICPTCIDDMERDGTL